MQSTELEHYLGKLEKALGPIPVSEKAEIITEIKSHVLEALDNDPSQSVSSILKSLGEPEQVANRYLLERGLEPQRPPKHPVLKWLVLGFLGTFAITALFVIVLVWRFTPLVDVDEQKGRVSLLGGAITVNADEEGKNFQWSSSLQSVKTAGSEPLTDDIQTVDIQFNNGSIELENSEDRSFGWDCEIEGGDVDATVNPATKTLQVNLKKARGAKCDLAVPAKMQVNITGDNGKLEIEKPHFHVMSKLTNGKVSIEPDENMAYNYETKLVNGKLDKFSSANTADAFNIRVELVNGKIRRK